MKTFAVLSLLSVFASIPAVLSAPATQAAQAAQAFAVAPIASIAGLEASNGDSRLFYQKSDGSIWTSCVSGHWDSGGKTTCDFQVVPRTEALLNTALAAAGDPDLNEWHLYFFSPTSTVSEYIFQSSSISSTNPSGIRGGASCTDCITAEAFNAVVAKNRALWAMFENDNGVNKLRVWFASAGQPNTITEAGKRGTDVWKQIGMPNSTGA
ncbi:hypothetical protein K435DRAFT_520523 [Dendrothele bispora CBS 962.96]|uniref:Uncharacterized protein n=1 Tax=Dendrothele bispora (strain CBS 962.96) TaxID=1314807 RepID=A0A4S8KVC1_DENBC|nr:hypothetical protein K435DRAFT_520523 [Dendrothele bispora CBS 962.96]